MARQGRLRKAMREYIAWLGERADDLISQLPGDYVRLRSRAMQEGGDAHGRSAEAVAHIMLGYEMMLRYMQDIGAISPGDAEAELQEAWGVVLSNARYQAEEAREDSPVNMFLSAIRELLASKQATVYDISAPNGGSVLPSTIGYGDAQYYYLLPDVAFSRVCKLYVDQGVVFPLNKRALFKQLKEEKIVIPDKDGKTANVKRIGSRFMRLLWLDRGKVDGTAETIRTASGEQLTMTVVDNDVDSPF